MNKEKQAIKIISVTTTKTERKEEISQHAHDKELLTKTQKEMVELCQSILEKQSERLDLAKFEDFLVEQKKERFNKFANIIFDAMRGNILTKKRKIEKVVWGLGRSSTWDNDGYGWDRVVEYTAGLEIINRIISCKVDGKVNSINIPEGFYLQNGKFRKEYDEGIIIWNGSFQAETIFKNEAYHSSYATTLLSAEKKLKAGIKKIQIRRNKEAKRLLETRYLAKLNLEKDLSFFVSIQDSLNAGNCQAETKKFVTLLKDKFGKIGGINANTLLGMRNDIYTIRAVQMAYLRQRK